MKNIKKQTRIQLFNEWAQNYEQAVGKNEGFPFEGYSDVLNTIIDLASIQPKMSVLDLGTGTGSLAFLFNKLSCDVFGVDFSHNMLEIARTNVPAATFIQADLLTDLTSIIDERFDRIVSAYVFHEFDLRTKKNLLHRLFEKHLQNDGLIIIGDVSFQSVKIRNEAKGKWKNYWDNDEHYWADDETTMTFEKTNIDLKYKQVSSCGGVYIFSNKST